MSYRRSPETLDDSRVWRQFVEANTHLLTTAGLPAWVTESHDRWADFLMHGHLDHHPDPARFTVDQLSDAEYGAVVRLAEAYFAAGYGFFSPMALRRGGAEQLQARFAPDW